MAAAPACYHHPAVAAASSHYYYYGAPAAPAPAPDAASAALTAATAVLARCPPTATAAAAASTAASAAEHAGGAAACATAAAAGKRGRTRSPDDDEGNPPEGRGDGKKRRRLITGRWNRMFQRLVRYRERHGTCHVVASASAASGVEADAGGGGDGGDTDTDTAAGEEDLLDDELCRWVRTQRNEYKKLKEGSESNKRKTTAMFDEKIDRLRSIGFDFGHYTVDERIEQLRRYREVMCDPNAVPSMDHPMLGTFVRRYRGDRVLRKQGRETKHFTEEELERLDDSVGSFEATAGTTATGEGRRDGEGENDDGNVVVPPDGTARRRRPTKSWNNMFEQLSQYRARHGTCEVPSGNTVAADGELRKRIRDQRTAYKRMLDGKPSQMYDEKVRRLRSVGFDMGNHHTFAERLEQLRHYRDGHPDDGSVVPPVDHPLLGKFVRRVLEDLRRIDDGKEPRHHTTRQIDLLRSSPGGFDAAKVQTSSSALRYHEPSEDEEREWDDMLNEWLRHREGHTANEWDNSGVVPPVPRGTPLSRWVQVQRMEYRKVKRGTTAEAASGGGGVRGKRAPWSSGPCRMTPRRLARLNDAGFDFGPRSGKYLSWDERLGQLRGYVEEHGHCRVPISHPVLGEWVEKTRTKYHRYVRGDDKPGITEERIRQLTELGFVFRAGKPPARPALCLPFEDRFRQLLEFKWVHGTTVVPQHYADVPGLGRWVKQQRNDYQRMVKGGKSSMTPQKALRLVEAGFVFDAKNRRGKRWTSGDG